MQKMHAGREGGGCLTLTATLTQTLPLDLDLALPLPLPLSLTSMQKRHERCQWSAAGWTKLPSRTEATSSPAATCAARAKKPRSKWARYLGRGWGWGLG